MGQTGVGKSSLLNALFNTNLKVGEVRPTTKEVESITLKNAKGHTLTFHDMPGIGESEEVDLVHLEKYRRYLLESNVVLWAIHADTRSVTFDARALNFLLEGMQPEQQSELISRITFVLTKVDLLAQFPWIMAYVEEKVNFTPAKEVKKLLNEKTAYFQEQFIEPYGEHMTSWTYNDEQCNLGDPFECTDTAVYYKGLLTKEKVDEFRKNHPKYAGVFERLYDNYRVIPCSSRFKYNLLELILVILNKLGSDAHESFKQAVDLNALEHMSPERGVQMCNLCIIDAKHKYPVFDLPKGIFPDVKRGDLAGLFQKTRSKNGFRFFRPTWK